MVLECAICLVDNSDFALNGDWKPDRLKGQIDGVRALANRKTNDNRESSVGVMVMAQPKVVITPTTDPGKISQAMYSIKPQGKIDVIRSIKIAQLVLKNRPNRNARQRIVLFIASPVDLDEKEFEKVCKQLKKNNVALDIVSISDHERHRETLSSGHAIVAAAQEDDCFLCELEPGTPGTTFFDDALRRCTVYTGKVEPPQRPASARGEEGDAVPDEDGDALAMIDPNDDPELYMAIQMSIREEQARVRREAERAAKGQTEAEQEEANLEEKTAEDKKND